MKVLTDSEAEHFVEKGYVVVKDAFSRELAETIVDAAWGELEAEHDIDRNDGASWNRPLMGPLRPGYVRTKGTGRRFRLREVAPRALEAQADVAGGVERFASDLSWSDAAIGNLGTPGERWGPPRARAGGWHKDGWHFRHFLGSPEQGLLTVPIYTDIEPESGGTFIATDSVGPVARFLAEHPQGLHPDSVQGAGYLIPGLIEQCTEFEELRGNAGDMAILHPFMLHRVSINPSTRPRFIANVAVVFGVPMNFNRTDGNYSLVEQSVLRALEVDACEYAQTRDALAFKPAPFRKEDEAAESRESLAEEMRAMAERGTITPAWAGDFGYSSNA